MMKYFIFLLSIFAGNLFGEPSHGGTPLSSNHFEAPFIYQTVNVITGDYCEAHTDAAGSSLKLRRCFSSSEGWTFNFPFIKEPSAEPQEGLIYEYDRFYRLSAIKTTNVDNGMLETIFNVNYSNDLKEMGIKAGSFGLTYQFAEPITSRNEGLPMLTAVLSQEEEICRYYYCKHPTLRKLLIAKKEEREGWYCINEYYELNDELVQSSSRDSLRDMRIGRVKLQKAPAGEDSSPIVTARFFYYPGYTEVLDALNRKTVYRYHPDGYITSIENYHDQELYRIEELFWKADSMGKPVLAAKALKDGRGTPHLCRTFEYDVHGNIVAETLYGNLSGSSSVPLYLNDKGIPLQNGVEHYTTRWCYDEEDPSRLLYKADDGGKVVRYAYDANDKSPSAEFICDENVILCRRFFEYDNSKRLVSIIMDDGNTNQADDLCGVTERHLTCFSYSNETAEPNLIEKKYLDLHSGCLHCLKQIFNSFDAEGRLCLQKVIAGGVLQDEYSFVYDNCGRLVSKSDGKGNSEESQFDGSGNCIFFKTVKEGKLVKEIYSFYDCMNRLMRTDELNGQGDLTTLHYRYNHAGEKILATDGFGNSTRYFYDDSSRLIKTIFPEVLDASDEAVEPIILRKYDLFDNVIEEVNANGYAESFRYNIRGQPVRKNYPDGTFESFEYAPSGLLIQAVARNGLIKRFQYNALGLPVVVEVCNVAGEILSYERHSYSPFHLLQTVESSGLTTQYLYDGAGLLTSKRQFSVDEFKRTDCAYDLEGRVAVQKEWWGSGEDDYIATEFLYSADGKLLGSFIKDAAGNLLKQELLDDELGLAANARRDLNQIVCNSLGQNVLQKVSTDVRGNTTIATFDALGRCEQVVVRNAFGDIVNDACVRYDLCGNKVKMIVFEHGIVKSERIDFWEYDSCNRLRMTTEHANSPYAKTTYYAYNNKGQLESVVKPDGTILYHLYSVDGKLKEFYSSDNSIYYRYAYDSKGHLVSVEDIINKRTTLRSYNSFGNVIKEDLGNGLELKKVYDSLGRCSQMTLPDSSFVSYTYNPWHLHSIQRFSKDCQLQYIHTYTSYDEAGDPLEMSLIGSVGRLSLRYDQKQRCHSIRSLMWEEEIATDGFDAEGNLVALAIADGAGKSQNTYTYDASYQLIKEEGGLPHTYTYDSRANRIAKDQVFYTVDSLDQLLSQSDAGKTVNYSYDKRGNRISKNNNGQQTIYSYDALDRLIKVEIEGQVVIAYSYDGFHRRLTKSQAILDPISAQWIPQQSLRYLYDGDCEIGAFDDNGRMVELRILGIGYGAEIGAAIAHEINGKLYAPIHDHRGAVCCLVDAETGDAAEYYRYSAFGEVEIYSASGEPLDYSSMGNPWLFSSKRFEKESGLYFYGKRYYDPTCARWLTKDPLGTFDGPNPYVFLQNNPLSSVDLHGLFTCSSLWQSSSYAKDAVFNAMESAAEYLTQFKRNFSYSNTMRSQWDNTAKKVLGTGFLKFAGYYHHDIASMGTYNIENEMSDKVRITLINGIMNVKADMDSSVRKISEAHGGNAIHYVFHPTEGWAGDILNCYLVKIGYVSSRAQMLAKTWKYLIREMGGSDGGGKILHYAHSIGATDTYTALNLLSVEEQQMIHVITLGSPTIIPSSAGCASVINYVSKRDGVCLLDPIGYFNGWFSADSNVSFLGTFWGVPLVEHTLFTHSYSELIKKLGEEFLNAFAPSP